MVREPIVQHHPAWQRAGTWIGRGIAIGLLALLGAVLAGLAVGAAVASYRSLLSLFT